MSNQFGSDVLPLTEALTERKTAIGNIKVNALLTDQHARARKDLQQPVEIEDVDAFPKPGDLYVDKRKWLRMKNVVVVSADLKDSTALSFNKYAQTSARLYEAATGSGVRLMAKSTRSSWTSRATASSASSTASVPSSVRSALASPSSHSASAALRR